MKRVKASEDAKNVWQVGMQSGLACALLLVGVSAAWFVSEVIAEEPVPTEAKENVEIKGSEKDFSVTKLAKLGRPAVVVIGFYGRDGKQQGMGTGFVISKDGLVATNLHVIGEARSIFVQTVDGKPLKVTHVYASDRALDLAVLRVEGITAAPLELGDSQKIEQGDPVIALGNPQGLKHSVVSGVISERREMAGRGMLQLAIPIEPGNSGGPVLDREGRVVGIVTMKSLVTENLGFAVEVAELQRLLSRPNTVPMEKWLTIGSLDAKEWKPRFGGGWQQRGGKVLASGNGDGFGGRMVCQSQKTPLELPYEVSVQVKLEAESGAAGLIFGDEGEHRHFGFYPSGGKLRLVRFDGPDIFHWQILEERGADAYRAGEWNELRVRVDVEGTRCFVNGAELFAMRLAVPADGRVGLIKFREQNAEFRRFQLGKEQPADVGRSEAEKQIAAVVDQLPRLAEANAVTLKSATDAPALATVALEQKVKELRSRANELEKISQDVKREAVIADLVKVCGPEVKEVDLLRAGLLLAQLDEADVEVEAYAQIVGRMVTEIQEPLAKDADDKTKLARLHQYLFEENGFHGSRVDYYHRANSYLNRVIDDREGIPITLSILYMELAKRIGLKSEGVGLPGHFMVRVHVPAEGEVAAEAGTLVDVFDGGKKLLRVDAEKMLREQTGNTTQESDWLAMSERGILLRVLQNLLGMAQRQGDVEALRRYLAAMIAIDPSLARQRGMKATLDFETGRIAESVQGLDWFFEAKPEGIDLEEIRSLRAQFEQRLPK